MRFAVQSFGGFRLVDLGVHNRDAVQNYADMVAAGDDFFVIPLACGLQVPSFGSHDAIDGTVCLPRLNGLISRRSIVENLNLHGSISWIARQRRADAHPV